MARRSPRSHKDKQAYKGYENALSDVTSDIGADYDDGTLLSTRCCLVLP